MTPFMNLLIQLVIPILWLAWWAYWRVSGRNVKAVQRRESVSSRLTHIVPIALAALLMIMPTGPGWLGQRMFSGSWALYWSGVLITAFGLGFSVWARRILGRNWSGTVTLKTDHELIQTGPYRLVRHPIYTGILLGFLGSAIARNEWRGLIALLLVSVALWRKLRMEERWLSELFGDRYAQYRESTWALIPHLL